MQRCTLVLFASTLVACFSPKVGPDASGSGTDSGGASSGGGSSEAGSSADGTDGTTTGPTTSPGTDTALDSSTGATTVAGDEDPIVGSFTVNGSTEPAEVDEGGTITLEAEASDDIGVVGVEFFDGEMSLGVDEDAPYELDVGVSSADSGSHVYRAVATDTVGQTGGSQEVVLSVNIVGGEVLFYREQLFESSTGLGGPGLAVATTAAGRVFVNGLVAGTVTGRILSFNDDLSSLWTDDNAGLTRARTVDLGDQVLASTWEDGTWTYALREQESPAVVDTLNIAVPVGDIVFALLGSRATSGGAGVVVTAAPNELASYSVALVGPDWTQEFPDTAVITDLDPMSDGSVLVTFTTDNACSPGSTTCLRRLEADGSTDWTAGVATGTRAAIHPDHSVVAVASRSDGGFGYTELSAEGTQVGPEQVLDARRDYVYIRDVSGDGSGGFVLVATLGGNPERTAVASRYNEAGDLTWDQDEVALASDSMGFGVSVLDDAVFVCGIEDLQTVGLSTRGDAFVAKLRL